MLDDIDRMERMCMERLRIVGKDADRMLPKTGPDAHRPTDQELMKFTVAMNQAYPPMPWIRPDGSQVVASAYLLAMSECEGGKALVKRIQGLMSPEEAF